MTSSMADSWAAVNPLRWINESIFKGTGTVTSACRTSLN